MRALFGWDGVFVNEAAKATALNESAGLFKKTVMLRYPEASNLD
jgi:hypothetical protein